MGGGGRAGCGSPLFAPAQPVVESRLERNEHGVATRCRRRCPPEGAPPVVDARAGEVRARVDRGSGASGCVGDGALSSPGRRRPHRSGSGRQPATRCEPLALGSGCSCRDDPRRHARGLGRRGRGRRAGLRPPDPRLRRTARAVLAARRSSEARHREARNAHPPGHLRREQRRQAVARLLVSLSRRLALVQLQDGRPDRPLRAGAGVPVQAQGARREPRRGRAHARAWCASVTATRRR